MGMFKNPFLESTLLSESGAFPFMAALLGASLTIVCFFPGLMTLDSFDQLSQARSGILSGWHPPLMAWTWSYLDKILPGPAGMLLLHVFLFWAGLAFLVIPRISNPYLATGMLLVIGLFPPVFALLGTIWKDVGMGVCLVFSASLIAFASQREKIIPLILTLPFLFYAFCVRHEGILAVFPFLVWGGVVACRILGPKDWRRAFVSGFLSLLLLMIFHCLNTFVDESLIANKSSSSPIQIVWIFDLIGISLQENENRLPSFLNDPHTPLSLEEFRGIYTPTSAISLFRGDSSLRRIPILRDQPELKGLKKIWARAVLENPGGYLRHRWNFYKSHLGLGEGRVCYPFQDGMGANSMGVAQKMNFVGVFLSGFLSKFRDSLFFRGWVYLLFGILFFILGMVVRSWEISAISFSGLLYGGFHFFTLATCDFRYQWWTVLSVLLCFIVLLSKILAEDGGNKVMGGKHEHACES